MRKLMIICIAAVMTFAFVGMSYAEVQNIKVNGELDVRGFMRRAFNLNASSDTSNNIPRTVSKNNSQDWFMSTTRVGVDADLTDNVSTVVKIVNQRDWGVRGINHTAGMTSYTTNADEFNVNIEEAYVKLSQFFYEPLTVTIGRQPLWFGKGLIVGGNYTNPDPEGNITAKEYTALNKFDAIKASLDFDPVTVDAIYSSIWQNAVGEEDKVDLLGVNAGYKFNSMNAEAEAYYFGKYDNGSVIPWNGAKSRNNVNTFGLRGSLDVIKELNVALEGAYQNGTYLGTPMQFAKIERTAWLADVIAEYSGLKDKFSWKPKFGAEWMFLSGPGDDLGAGDNQAVASGRYRSWDPMFVGRFTSSIRSFIGWFYPSAQYSQINPVTGLYEDSILSNNQSLIGFLSLNPIDSLTLKANYNFYWFADRLTGNRSNYNGSELDVTAKYDYTEDVSFGLLAGFFAPGAAYSQTDSRSTAAQMIGSVKVNF